MSNDARIMSNDTNIVSSNDIAAIVVHLDGSAPCNARVAAACRLARAFDARLLGIASTGALALPYQAEAPVSAQVWSQTLEAQQASSRAAAAAFVQACRAEGLSLDAEPPQARALSLVAEHEEALLHYGSLADLTVLSLPTDPTESALALSSGALASVALALGRPVLLVPPLWNGAAVPKTALFAWSHTAECARALRDALPFLRRAQHCHVLLLNAAEPAFAQAQAPTQQEQLQAWLQAHGVRAQLHCETTRVKVGAAILDAAERLQADFIGMGAWGHSRLREMLFGGASQNVLSGAKVPVLMSH